MVEAACSGFLTHPKKGKSAISDINTDKGKVKFFSVILRGEPSVLVEEQAGGSQLVTLELKADQKYLVNRGDVIIFNKGGGICIEECVLNALSQEAPHGWMAALLTNAKTASPFSDYTDLKPFIGIKYFGADKFKPSKFAKVSEDKEKAYKLGYESLKEADQDDAKLQIGKAAAKKSGLAPTFANVIEKAVGEIGYSIPDEKFYFTAKKDKVAYLALKKKYQIYQGSTFNGEKSFQIVLQKGYTLRIANDSYQYDPE
jgi:hypothetical protein